MTWERLVISSECVPHPKALRVSPALGSVGFLCPQSKPDGGSADGFMQVDALCVRLLSSSSLLGREHRSETSWAASASCPTTGAAQGNAHFFSPHSLAPKLTTS